MRGWIHSMIDVFEREIGHGGGPSHNVIEDYNITDSNILSDVNYINECIRTGQSEYSAGELRCIKGFLLALLKIPKIERARQAHAYFDWNDKNASVEDYLESSEE